MGNTQHAMQITASKLHSPLYNGQATATHPCVPGVLVLSQLREPVYVTDSTRQLLAELAGFPGATWTDHAPLPLPIHAICDTLERATQQEWSARHLQQLIYRTSRSVLVHGYGVCEGSSSRFLLLLSIEAQTFAAPVPVPECHFTNRQQAILKGLIRGETNKEIARSLTISVHTVKEYVRHLMTKLKTRTRSGIVAQMAGFTPPTRSGSPLRSRARSSKTVRVASARAAIVSTPPVH